MNRDRSLIAPVKQIDPAQEPLSPREWRLEVWRVIQEYVYALTPEHVSQYMEDRLPFDEELQRRFRERGLIPSPSRTELVTPSTPSASAPPRPYGLSPTVSLETGLWRASGRRPARPLRVADGSSSSIWPVAIRMT